MKNRHRYREKQNPYSQWHRPEIKNLWPIFFISRDIFIVPLKSCISRGKKRTPQNRRQENGLFSVVSAVGGDILNVC